MKNIFKNLSAMVMMVQTPAGEKFFELGYFNNHLINVECLKKKCEAKKALKRFKPVKAEIGLDGYIKNPYSQVCQNAKGRGIILRDILQNQHYFCEFKDGSLIGLDAVNYQEP